jgi:hypothetical protein
MRGRPGSGLKCRETQKPEAVDRLQMVSMEWGG